MPGWEPIANQAKRTADHSVIGTRLGSRWKMVQQVIRQARGHSSLTIGLWTSGIYTILQLPKLHYQASYTPRTLSPDSLFFPTLLPYCTQPQSALIVITGYISSKLPPATWEATTSPNSSHSGTSLQQPKKASLWWISFFSFPFCPYIFGFHFPSYQ